MQENIVFVHASPEDANMFHLYQTMLHGENDIYFRNAKECERLGTDKVKAFILDSLKSTHSALFILKDMNTKEIYGHIHIQSGQTARNRHKAEIYLGVLKQFQHIGVGIKLMEIAEFWARKEGLERMQLSVFENNDRAIKFYEKHGFLIEGRLVNGVKLDDGSYIDELIMGKVIEPIYFEEQAQ
jgi:ribosomal protein S18 acetylase RimI-like enzyme